jgi:glyoxylase-like metal-dependent hydrolase (beta-lactamase superfamily II)
MTEDTTVGNEWTRIGDVEVARVIEWLGTVGSVDDMFPETPADAWTTGLAPHFWVPEERGYRAAIQTWVLRSHGRTVLVDTGVGNGRNRPQVPVFANLQTDFLGGLSSVGVDPESVDIVINTHIHYDHVGWNTKRNGDGWIPTFPNATYLIPAADFDYYHPENAGRMRPPTTEDERRRFDGIRLVFEDSVAPLVGTGQLHTWSEEYRIDDVLRLEPAPGHTPGSSVVWLRSGNGGVFVGDLLHTPLQISRPGDSCAFDLDAERARVSRRAILRAASNTGATVFPAHFAGKGGTSVQMGTEKDEEFSASKWADLSPI